MEGEDMVFPIGLDGNYRISPEGAGFRGYWENPQLFYFEVFNIGVTSREVTFDDQNMQISIPEAELKVNCQVQNP
jgi:hypothetical protein